MNERTDKSTCPDCKQVVQLKGLDYGECRQEAYCPMEHGVFRIWNGPENPFYDKTIAYGWSPWQRMVSI